MIVTDKLVGTKVRVIKPFTTGYYNVVGINKCISNMADVGDIFKVEQILLSLDIVRVSIGNLLVTGTVEWFQNSFEEVATSERRSI